MYLNYYTSECQSRIYVVPYRVCCNTTVQPSGPHSPVSAPQHSLSRTRFRGGCPASRASIPLAVLLLHATLQAKGAAASYATLQNACRQRADSLHLVSTLTLGEPACLGNLGW